MKQLLELGGTLDGPIQFTSDKSKTVEKIAAMTTMDGHSIGLFEPKEKTNSSNSTIPGCSWVLLLLKA